MTYTPALDNSDLLSWEDIRAVEDLGWSRDFSSGTDRASRSPRPLLIAPSTLRIADFEVAHWVFGDGAEPKMCALPAQRLGA
jgi:hypothetical protein